MLTDGGTEKGLLKARRWRDEQRGRMKAIQANQMILRASLMIPMMSQTIQGLATSSAASYGKFSHLLLDMVATMTYCISYTIFLCGPQLVPRRTLLISIIRQCA